MSSHSILLIGASGRTGLEVLAVALARGMQVTALVRNPDKIPPQANLSIFKGSPTSLQDILAAILTSAIPITEVTVTLNARRASDSPFAKSIAPPRLMADTHAAIVSAMRQHPGIRKIITLSAFGVADSRANTGWLLDLLFRHTNMAAQYEDHDLVDAEVKASGLPFVLVRPMRLVEGDGKAEIKHWGDQGEDVSTFASISRTSVARFLVDSVESDEWNGRTPIISN